MSIFYGLVQMIRWLLLLGFNSVCFYNTRNRPLFGNEEKTKKGQSEDCPFCYGFVRRTYAFFSAIAACAAARRAIGTRNGEQDT